MLYEIGEIQILGTGEAILGISTNYLYRQRKVQFRFVWEGKHVNPFYRLTKENGKRGVKSIE